MITVEDPTLIPNLRSVFVQIQGVGGYEGYFEVPITQDGNAIVATLEASPSLQPSGAVTAVVQLMDNSGNYGNQVSVPLPSSNAAMAEAMATAAGQYRVRGKATYEDFAQTEQGLAKTSTKLPIRFAMVEVRRASSGKVLARGSTGQDGRFDIRFSNKGKQSYKVLIWTKQDNAILTQTVHNNRKTVYHVASAKLTNALSRTLRWISTRP